ncbi:MAG: efflux RND transporter periplasmic adaptor subunit [Bdellovibrio sp.]
MSAFEAVTNANNRFLFFSWSIAVMLIFTFGFILNTESVSMLGLAESHEFQVNFDSPVTIKKIHVLPGQIVKKGDLLLELSQESLNLQIHNLKAKYEKLAAELKLRKQISSLTQQMDSLPIGADPLQVELFNTKREIEILEMRMRNLLVLAEVDGAIGSVNFKSGEKAPSFSSLVTLVPLNPTYVNAFINENLTTKVEIGQTVEVSANNGKGVYGRIVNVGSRIIPIPQRLLRIQSLQAWGREVVIKIPPSNNFLIGEKVNIRKTWGFSLFSNAQAEEEHVKWVSRDYEIKKINFPDTITDRFSPEISGLVYVPELKKFAMISDDYPDSQPQILLMDSFGDVSEQMLPIEGLDKMKDIESISLSGPYMYLLSSLSSKKSFVSESRQQFVKIKRIGLNLQLEDSVNLREALLLAMERSNDRDIKNLFNSTFENSGHLEIEGHFIKDNDLYVALKHPVLSPNHAAILKIKSVDKLFLQKNISDSDLSVAYKIDITMPNRKDQSFLTDIISANNTVYAASTCAAEKCSAIWKLNLNSHADLIYEFNEKKLEGIAISPEDNQIYGVFDHKKSKFVVVPVTSLKGPQ